MKHSKQPPLFRKPRPDFPLHPHAAHSAKTARWAKKVRGDRHYFGRCADDPKGQRALELWLEQRDDLLAGRTPRAKGDGLTVATLAASFLAFKEGLLNSGELAPRTFARYEANCEMLTKHFGGKRLVDDLAAGDFQELRADMAKRWGPVALANEIQIVRSAFRYGFEAGLIEKPVRFGPGFQKPSAKTMRTTRAARGPKMFTADQIQKLIAAASPTMGAMILLAINGGLGNGDVAALTLEVCDGVREWLDYPRPKTGIARRIPLWPETLAAVQKAIEHRPTPKDKGDAILLFIGRRGQNYLSGKNSYRVTQEFDHALEGAGLEGRTFYDLRRTFQTIAEGAHDLVAVQSIMGHAPASGDMSSIYRQRIDDARLKAVTDYVRTWLYGEPAKQSTDTHRPAKRKAKHKPAEAPNAALRVFG